MAHGPKKANSVLGKNESKASKLMGAPLPDAALESPKAAQKISKLARMMGGEVLGDITAVMSQVNKEATKAKESFKDKLEVNTGRSATTDLPD